MSSLLQCLFSDVHCMFSIVQCQVSFVKCIFLLYNIGFEFSDICFELSRIGVQFWCLIIQCLSNINFVFSNLGFHFPKLVFLRSMLVFHCHLHVKRLEKKLVTACLCKFCVARDDWISFNQFLTCYSAIDVLLGTVLTLVDLGCRNYIKTGWGGGGEILSLF